MGYLLRDVPGILLNTLYAKLAPQISKGVLPEVLIIIGLWLRE